VEILLMNVALVAQALDARLIRRRRDGARAVTIPGLSGWRL
jgi:hypothetical protein